MKRALVSVTNKDGIVEFCQGLETLGFEIVSTGGTLKKLVEAGVKAIPIDEVTGFPEMLDGRVKTLHPMVHGGLLYRRDLQSHVDTISKPNVSSSLQNSTIPSLLVTLTSALFILFLPFHFQFLIYHHSII